MPDSTSMTPGCEAAKRMAQLGTDFVLSYPLNSSSAAAGTFARVPPLTGSMTMTGLLCFRQTSRQARDWIHSLSQSR